MNFPAGPGPGMPALLAELGLGARASMHLLFAGAGTVNDPGCGTTASQRRRAETGNRAHPFCLLTDGVMRPQAVNSMSLADRGLGGGSCPTPLGKTGLRRAWAGGGRSADGVPQRNRLADPLTSCEPGRNGACR